MKITLFILTPVITAFFIHCYLFLIFAFPPFNVFPFAIFLIDFFNLICLSSIVNLIFKKPLFQSIGLTLLSISTYLLIDFFIGKSILISQIYFHQRLAFIKVEVIICVITFLLSFFLTKKN